MEYFLENKLLDPSSGEKHILESVKVFQINISRNMNIELLTLK